MPLQHSSDRLLRAMKRGRDSPLPARAPGEAPPEGAGAGAADLAHRRPAGRDRGRLQGPPGLREGAALRAAGRLRVLGRGGDAGRRPCRTRSRPRCSRERFERIMAAQQRHLAPAPEGHGGAHRGGAGGGAGRGDRAPPGRPPRPAGAGDRRPHLPERRRGLPRRDRPRRDHRRRRLRPGRQGGGARPGAGQARRCRRAPPGRPPPRRGGRVSPSCTEPEAARGGSEAPSPRPALPILA